MIEQNLKYFEGALIGGAIGDAMGWITEFLKSKQNLFERFNTKYLDEFVPWDKRVGTRYNGYTDRINAGDYSDDTQLMLATTRSINKKGDFNPEYFSDKELPFWLNYDRGAGRTIKTASRKIQRKTVSWYNNFFEIWNKDKLILDYQNSGANGAAMRVSPIALANLDNTEKIIEDTWKNAIITHGHPRAIIGALLFNLSIQYVFQNRKKFDAIEFIIFLGKDAIDNLSCNFSDLYLKKWVNNWNINQNKRFEDLFSETKEEAKEYLRIIYKAVKNNIDDKVVIKNLGCFAEDTKGSGLGTVCAGIYYFCLNAYNLEKSITEPVNSIGTDTDSIANFSGTLSGSLLGIDSIPDKWLKVQDISYIKRIAEFLLTKKELEIQKFNKENVIDINLLRDCKLNSVQKMLI